MPIKYKGLTIREHIELGRKIKEIKRLSTEVLNEIQHNYGKSSLVGKRARTFITTNNLCAELDNQVCRETTNEDWQREGFTWVYYGGEINDLRKDRGLLPIEETKWWN
jgi:hypothetical protein